MPQSLQARPLSAVLGDTRDDPSWPHLRVVVLHCLPQHLVLPLACGHHHPPCPPNAGVSKGPIPCNLTAGVHNNHALLEAVRKQPCHVP